MYTTINKIEEDLCLFAVEYVATHWTENRNKTDEPVMFSILEKVEYADDLRTFMEDLTSEEEQKLKFSLHVELKWCKETIASESIQEPQIEEVKILQNAYNETLLEIAKIEKQ